MLATSDLHHSVSMRHSWITDRQQCPCNVCCGAKLSYDRHSLPNTKPAVALCPYLILRLYIGTHVNEVAGNACTVVRSGFVQ